MDGLNFSHLRSELSGQIASIRRVPVTAEGGEKKHSEIFSGLVKPFDV